LRERTDFVKLSLHLHLPSPSMKLQRRFPASKIVKRHIHPPSNQSPSISLSQHVIKQPPPILMGGSNGFKQAGTGSLVAWMAAMRNGRGRSRWCCPDRVPSRYWRMGRLGRCRYSAEYMLEVFGGLDVRLAFCERYLASGEIEEATGWRRRRVFQVRRFDQISQFITLLSRSGQTGSRDT